MKAKESKISIANLRELLDYNPETGVLRWKARGRQWFRRDRDWKAFNTRHAGSEALSCVNSRGYKTGAAPSAGLPSSLAHRVAWAIHTGAWPEGEIDHENGVRHDNRFVNLRDVTRAENMKNKSAYANGKTGVAGVRRHSAKGWLYWEASAYIDGTQRRKYFPHTDEGFAAAVEWRDRIKSKLGYHNNHGRKAA